VGMSGAPRGPYSTSGMAEDVVVLLDMLGWTNERDLNVVGISLGGMIAQELATRIPERILTLSLIVTTPGNSLLGFWNNIPPWKGFTSLLRLLATTDPAVKIPISLEMLFPMQWLNSISDDDPKGRTNRAVQTESLAHRILITKPQTPVGAISQMIAGLTHHVSTARLHAIATSIPKIMILTGDEDNLIRPANSFLLAKSMPEAEFVQWDKTGHGIHIQEVARFNKLLEKVFKEGRAKLEETRAREPSQLAASP